MSRSGLRLIMHCPLRTILRWAPCRLLAPWSLLSQSQAKQNFKRSRFWMAKTFSATATCLKTESLCIKLYKIITPLSSQTPSSKNQRPPRSTPQTFFSCSIEVRTWKWAVWVITAAKTRLREIWSKIILKTGSSSKFTTRPSPWSGEPSLARSQTPSSLPSMTETERNNTAKRTFKTDPMETMAMGSQRSCLSWGTKSRTYWREMSPQLLPRDSPRPTGKKWWILIETDKEWTTTWRDSPRLCSSLNS